MFCVFHGIETRPMLLLTPYKSNNMLETICYIDVHRIMCRLKRNFYLRTSDKKKGEREERKSKTRKYLTNFHQFSKWQTRFILPNRTWFSNRSDRCQQQRTFSHTLDETTLIATLRGKQLRVWSSSLLGINEKKKKKGEREEVARKSCQTNFPINVTDIQFDAMRHATKDQNHGDIRSKRDNLKLSTDRD